MILLQVIFWVSLSALVHTYLLYPLILKLLSFSHSSIPSFSDATEKVSILIAAYNEEKVIKEKLESIFNSDYPKEKIEVIVGSDASTDRTNEIVRAFTGVQLVEFKGRSGKVKIINHLKSLAKHDILILTDANVMFDKQTLFHLTKHFQEQKIALVDSNMVNTNQQGKGVAKAESTYIRGEVGIKNNEGKVFGTMIGPFGGCYAVRKDFYENVPENFLVDDFYINMKVLEKGGKAISETEARVYEEVPTDWKVEFKRKVRIATGSFQNLKAFAHLLFRFNTLSFCFLSHKVLRWMGPFFLAGLFASSLYLVFVSMIFESFYSAVFAEAFRIPLNIYTVTFILELFAILLFFLDLLLKLLGVNFLITRLATHFFTTNLALLIGFFKFIGGVRSSIWDPTKR